MAVITSVSNMKVLIVDDMPEIRKQLQMSLGTLGFEKLQVVSNIKEAMERITSIRFDVILCDYNLGDGTNGQQLLEYLRTNDLLPRNCLFIMITAENSYESVVTAAECMPDDYLLKPFTAGQFLARFEKLLERKILLETIDTAHDKRNWFKVINECDRILTLKNKYYIDICKIKAATLMLIDRAEEASKIYNEVLKIRELPWAQLGLARAKAKLGNFELSREISSKLMQDHPHFVANFDFMSELLMHDNQPELALETLKQASAICPSNLNRTRHLGAMAIANGEHAEAEALLAKTLKKHRHSPVRQAADYALLSRALSEQNKTKEALTALKEASSHFQDEYSSIVIAASKSIAHNKAGNHEEAEKELNKALAGNTKVLPPAISAALAEACFVGGKEEVANTLLKQILQNNPDDIRLQSRVKMVCASVGKSISESIALIQESSKEIIKINNEGVSKAKAGQYKEAIELIISAAERLPNNLSIISNAALILAASIANSDVTEDMLKLCLQYRQRVVDLNPDHPKLSQIDSMLKKTKELA